MYETEMAQIHYGYMMMMMVMQGGIGLDESMEFQPQSGSDI
jgi:hypothetical protein